MRDGDFVALVILAVIIYPCIIVINEQVRKQLSKLNKKTFQKSTVVCMCRTCEFQTGCFLQLTKISEQLRASCAIRTFFLLHASYWKRIVWTAIAFLYFVLYQFQFLLLLLCFPGPFSGFTISIDCCFACAFCCVCFFVPSVLNFVLFSLKWAIMKTEHNFFSFDFNSCCV